MAVSTKAKIIGGAVVGVIAVAWVGGTLMTKSKTEDDFKVVNDSLPMANMLIKAKGVDLTLKSFDKVDGGLFSDAYKLVVNSADKEASMLFNNSFGLGSVKSQIELNDDLFDMMGVRKDVAELIKKSMSLGVNASTWSNKGSVMLTFDDGSYSMDKGTFKWGDVALKIAGTADAQSVEFTLPDFSFELDDKNWIKVDDVFFKSEGEFMTGKGTKVEMSVGEVDSKRGSQEINLNALDADLESDCDSSMLCEAKANLSLKGVKYPMYEIGKTKLSLNLEGIDFAAAAKACGLEPNSDNFVATVNCLKEDDDKNIYVLGKKTAFDIDFETSINNADVSLQGEFKVTADDMSNPMQGLLSNGFKAKATLKVDKELFKAIPLLAMGQSMLEQFDPGASTYKLKLECEGLKCEINGKPL